MRVSLDESSGDSSCYTWNGYLIDISNPLSSEGTGSFHHPLHFDEVCDCGNGTELAREGLADFPDFQLRDGMLTTGEDSEVWVEQSAVEHDKPPPPEHQTGLVMPADTDSDIDGPPEPSLEGRKQSEMQATSFAGAVRGTGKEVEVTNKYIMNCTEVDCSFWEEDIALDYPGEEDISLDYPGMEQACEAHSSGDSKLTLTSASLSPNHHSALFCTPV